MHGHLNVKLSGFVSCFKQHKHIKSNINLPSETLRIAVQEVHFFFKSCVCDWSCM